MLEKPVICVVWELNNKTCECDEHFGLNHLALKCEIKTWYLAVGQMFIDKLQIYLYVNDRNMYNLAANGMKTSQAFTLKYTNTLEVIILSKYYKFIIDHIMFIIYTHKIFTYFHILFSYNVVFVNLFIYYYILHRDLPTCLQNKVKL